MISKLAKGTALEDVQKPSAAPSLTISQLLLKYVTEELPRYHPDEQHCQKGAIRILREMFGESPILGDASGAGFGPLKLRLVRDAMVNGDPNARDSNGNPQPRKPWSRDYINHQIRRLRGIFRWAVSWEIIPQTVADALKSLRPLAPGETMAVDYKPREAVPASDIDAVRQLLKPRDRDILNLMLLTGARPGEVIRLKVGDVDRTGDTWRCELKQHKTRHKGKKRILLFNRAAQAILMRHIKADPEARFFTTSTGDFSNRIKAKCGAAGITPWVPHQLRHTTGTRLADSLGLEAAQRVLGHSDKLMTETYTRAAEKAARDAVQVLDIG